MTPNNRDRGNVVELPGQSMVIGVFCPPVGASSNARAETLSATPPFETVRHLLSKKPLKRPNRLRPIK